MKKELMEKETGSRLKKSIRVCGIACPVSSVCMGVLALVNAYTLFSDRKPVLFWSLFSVVLAAIIVFFSWSISCVVRLRRLAAQMEHDGEEKQR